MSTNKSYDVVIIGAGLTGLTTAFYLSRAGVDVVVIDKKNSAGGVIQTKDSNGFIYETGPNTGVLGNKDVVDLFKQLKGTCELEIADPKAKRRLIWKEGRWHDLAGGPKAVFTPLFTWKDKFRAIGEPFRKKGDDPDENLSSFVKRRLGTSILDYAVDPFVSGVYAGDPERLIPKYALPKLYYLEQDYGSLIKGSIKKKNIFKEQRKAGITREVFSTKGGLHQLINALEGKIGHDNIFLGAENTVVEKSQHSYKTNFSINDDTFTFQSKHVITTVGGYALSELVPFIEEKLLTPVVNLNYAKVTQVTVGYKQWNGGDIKAFGGLVPTKEQKDILGILYTSSFFKDRAPKNGALLSIFMGGMKKPHLINLSDNEIKNIVDQHLREMLGVSLFQSDLIDINRYYHAIPQYEITSSDRLKAIAEIEQQYPGLIVAGGIRDGIGMADRIKQARQIANTILEL